MPFIPDNPSTEPTSQPGTPFYTPPIGHQPAPLPPGVPYSWMGPAGGMLGDVAGAGIAGALAPETAGSSALAAPSIMATTSGLGQMGGRALQMALLRAQHSPYANQPGNYGTNFIQGAGSSVVGQGLMGVAKGIARPLMGSALRTADKTAIDAALNENIAPGRAMLRGGTGTNQVANRTSQLIGAQQSELAKMAASGKSFQIDDIAKPAFDVLETLRKDAQLAPKLQPEYDALMSDWYDFVDANAGKKLAPGDVQRIKQIYSDLASSAYKQGEAGKPVSAISDRELAVYKAHANQARSALADMSSKLGATNERLAAMTHLSPAMAKAEGAVPQFHAGMALSPGGGEGVPHFAWWANPLALVPPHPIGVAALGVNRFAAPALRGAPWVANAAAAMSNNQ